MTEIWFCDFCLYPDPDGECPLHGPTAMARLSRLLIDKIEEVRRMIEC